MNQLNHDEISFVQNFVPNGKGSLVKLKGYKREAGLLAMIKKANRNCLKFRTSVQITITLPIKI